MVLEDCSPQSWSYYFKAVQSWSQSLVLKFLAKRLDRTGPHNTTRELDSERGEVPCCARVSTCAHIDSSGRNVLYTTHDKT